MNLIKRTKMMKEFEKYFEKVDVIVTPTQGSGTFKITETDCKCELFMTHNDS